MLQNLPHHVLPRRLQLVYLCPDVSCQRILKTMLLQKLEDLIFNMDDPQKRQSSSLNLQCRSPSLFEDYLIALVKHLSQKKWNRGATTNITTNSILKNNA